MLLLPQVTIPWNVLPISQLGSSAPLKPPPPPLPSPPLSRSSGCNLHRSHPEIVLSETETTVTISRTAFELLQLKDRAMDSIKEGITIADCSQPDMPLIYANQGFSRITGTQVADVLGKNCRFLQVIFPFVKLLSNSPVSNDRSGILAMTS